jgi:uncharacterized protein YjbJ (UPF0337 family)
MNWDQIQGQWKQMKGKARERWGQLTDDDIEEAGGDRDRLEGKLQERYGHTKEQARSEVDKWMAEQ